MTQHTLPSPADAVAAEKRLKADEARNLLAQIKEGLMKGEREFPFAFPCQVTRDLIAEDARLAGWSPQWVQKPEGYMLKLEHQIHYQDER